MYLPVSIVLGETCILEVVVGVAVTAVAVEAMAGLIGVTLTVVRLPAPRADDVIPRIGCNWINKHIL